MTDGKDLHLLESAAGPISQEKVMYRGKIEIRIWAAIAQCEAVVKSGSALTGFHALEASVDLY